MQDEGEHHAQGAHSSWRVVLCTIDTHEAATRLAQRIVGEGLAACVNIVPGLTSVYRWEGGVESDSELLLIIKTSADRYADLERSLTQHHSYDLPEIIAVAIDSGLAGYLDWVTASTRATTAQ